MSRKIIPSKLRCSILYKSRYVCTICQSAGCQIHHIDGDNSNNSEANLVALCAAHHDEAHTNRKMSQNLGKAALLDAKMKWENEVRLKRESTATVSGQLSMADYSPLASIGITWGYINHNRVAQLADTEALNAEDKEYLHYCANKGLVDQKGVLIKPHGIQRARSYTRNSIYDWYEYGDDQRLHKLYTAFVDQISRAVQPIHIEKDTLTKTRVKQLVTPGSFIFLVRGFYFRTVDKTSENQHRLVRTFRRKISIEFYIDTRNMFGTTSMTVSFTGHMHCAAFLHVKSIEDTQDGNLILHCTPIGLGVAFNMRW